LGVFLFLRTNYTIPEVIMGRKRRLRNSAKFKAKHSAHPRMALSIPEVELVVETTAPEPEIAPVCPEKTEAPPTLQEEKPKPTKTRKRTTTTAKKTTKSTPKKRATTTRSRARKKTTTQNKE